MQKAVVGYMKLLSRDSCMDTEENYETSHHYVQ
jgi:hypothetical protein